MINLAPDFWPIFGPLGPTVGPGSLGTGLASKNIVGRTKNQPLRPIISLTRGYFVFLGPTAKRSKCKYSKSRSVLGPCASFFCCAERCVVGI
jgi:hypothetical protein